MVVFSLMRWSSHVPSGFLVSRRTLDTASLISPFTYGTFTLFHPAFQLCSVRCLKCRLQSSTPHILLYVVWAPPISLATTFGIVFYFLFLRVIRWFSSPGSPRMTIDSSYDNTTLLVLSFLIRTSADQCSFATPRSFSQLVTSFFGAMYQGILHTLFVAYSLLIAFSQSVELFSLVTFYVSKILDLSMCFHINLIFLGLFKVYFFFLSLPSVLYCYTLLLSLAFAKNKMLNVH